MNLEDKIKEVTGCDGDAYVHLVKLLILPCTFLKEVEDLTLTIDQAAMVIRQAYNQRIASDIKAQALEYAEGEYEGNVDLTNPRDLADGVRVLMDESYQDEIVSDTLDSMNWQEILEGEAIKFLKIMIDRLGQGYHPDDPLDQYINVKTERPTFTAKEIHELQPRHDQMMEILGDKVYDLGLEMFKAQDYSDGLPGGKEEE